jgi:hypothetical protein
VVAAAVVAVVALELAVVVEDEEPDELEELAAGADEPEELDELEPEDDGDWDGVVDVLVDPLSGSMYC